MVAITDAFAILKSHFMRVAVWGLLLYLPFVVVMLAMLPILIAAAASGGTSFDPEALGFGSSLAINAANGLSQFLTVGVMVLIYAALGFMMWGRSRPKTWLGLRFGMDEGRILLVLLAIMAAAFFGAMVVAIVIAMIAFPVGLASEGAAVAISVPLVLVALAGFVWVGIRASLIIPATLDRGKLAFVEGWKATKGHFWRLLGTALLALLCTILIALIFVASLMAAALVFVLIAGVATGWNFDTPATGTMIALIVPGLILYFAAVAVLGGIQVVMMQGPWYSVWKQLNHSTVEPEVIRAEPAAQI
ncbi:hypothetical protein [Brevundimonas sp. UBA5866]|nr:hypothetical protein [Brevundimonas sp. UBA5866]